MVTNSDSVYKPGRAGLGSCGKCLFENHNCLEISQKQRLLVGVYIYI